MINVQLSRPTIKLYPQPINVEGLHTRYVHPGELEALVHLINSVGASSVLEVGTNSGRTAKAILNNVPTVKRVWGIDVPPTYVPQRRIQNREVMSANAVGQLALDDSRYRMLITQHGSLSLDAYDLPKFDAVFIDGDHGETALRHDYALAKAVLRDGKGIIIFHDDNNLPVVDVSRVLNSFAAEGSLIMHVENTWLAYEVFN